jgi:hypothetical protein
MTEAEAATKWCPMVRLLPGTPPESNLPSGVTTCIGSECMAWRWKSGSQDDGYCGLCLGAGP